MKAFVHFLPPVSVAYGSTLDSEPTTGTRDCYYTAESISFLFTLLFCSISQHQIHQIHIFIRIVDICHWSCQLSCKLAMCTFSRPIEIP